MWDLESHLSHIERTVTGGMGKGDSKWLASSWGRCLRDYRLDPSRNDLVTLTDPETRREAERFDGDLTTSQTQLERTLQIIEGGGYSAHIANELGVIIHERRSKSETYYCSVDRIGALWSEEIGGTNGIGTALLTEMPAAVYLNDHFFADMTHQACAAAPFFRHDGEVMGIINLSTRNPSLPKLAHRVIFGIAQSSAQELELRYFRQHFEKHYTLHLSITGSVASPVLLAVDSDFCLLGASRAARTFFDLDAGRIGSTSLWSIFEKLRGDPVLADLRETLRELRPLGERDAIAVQIYQPLNGLHLKSKLIPVPPVRPVAARPATRPKTTGTALEDCAGADPDLRRNMDMLKRIYGSGLNILLLGETGVGKDTVARALHFESDRAGGPYVAFNCAAVPDSLIDSELFGYAAGAFTGANKAGNSGRIADAHRGTLFLDEIGDMPLALQTRLLRFLETREVTPLGSGKSQTVDTQVIAATHQDLEMRVEQGLFRKDLFYRLTGLALMLPALREREDIVDIARRILRGEAAADGPPSLTDGASEKLSRHDWPGNIRELRNVMIRALHLSDGKTIGESELIFETLRSRCRGGGDEVMARGAAHVDEERAQIVKAIEAAHGDATICAENLKISRATLYRKLRKYGLSLRSD